MRAVPAHHKMRTGPHGKTGPLKARTTSQFLAEFGLQLAVNGDYFGPTSGGGVDVTGLAASRGVVYSKPASGAPTLYFSTDGRARFREPIGPVYHAISGKPLLHRGLMAAKAGGVPEPRTALALDRTGRRLFMVVVDGRQPGYSTGATLEELAAIIVLHGGYEALNMDGGGSSALARRGDNGRPVLLSSPIDDGVPGQERAVGNHLGIYARDF